ncbi:hypothetical protein GNI_014550 [Gregarina niphandrodes]|uniref:Transmembrane protein n=1 Tax=Gregarina niphandrodes TaxID=110365 RepID=A0A023BCC2_GRENI|nr:hypothetical protein GNI_014550 [Gregarina niphandrodes]EZG83565.1 hypothetical protein GNI_014550 [Gregarina niphandrodes]|eukprot:XP_011128926.1 hypothetical protein GNI_014550 [Gregarina niphandrodes]
MVGWLNFALLSVVFGQLLLDKLPRTKWYMLYVDEPVGCSECADYGTLSKARSCVDQAPCNATASLMVQVPRHDTCTPDQWWIKPTGIDFSMPVTDRQYHLSSVELLVNTYKAQAGSSYEACQPGLQMFAKEKGLVTDNITGEIEGSVCGSRLYFARPLNTGVVVNKTDALIQFTLDKKSNLSLANGYWIKSTSYNNCIGLDWHTLQLTATYTNTIGKTNWGDNNES